VQSKFFYGTKPFQGGATFDAALANSAANAPSTPFGLQQFQQPLTPQEVMNAYSGTFVPRAPGPVATRMNQPIFNQPTYSMESPIGGQQYFSGSNFRPQPTTFNSFVPQQPPAQFNPYIPEYEDIYDVIGQPVIGQPVIGPAKPGGGSNQPEYDEYGNPINGYNPY
jgi:hypothetical protein